MHYLVIAPPEKKDGTTRKGRTFRVVKLAHVTADSLWEGGAASTDDVRPVFLMIAGTGTELTPFLANLRTGKKADLATAGARERYSRDKPTRFALLKSAGYSFARQRLPEGEILTAYLPEVTNLDPGMIDPKRAQFLCLTPCWWRDAQLATLAEGPALARQAQRLLPVAGRFSEDELIALVPQAAHVAAYLERRTRRPIPSHPAFALLLLLCGLAQGVLSLSATDAVIEAARWSRGRRSDPADRWEWARHTWATGFVEEGLADVGLLPGVVCQVQHDDLDSFLAALVRRYLEDTHGPT